MQKMKALEIPFGASVTVTTENMDEVFGGEVPDCVRVGLYRGEPWFGYGAEAVDDRASAVGQRLCRACVGYAADPAVESFGRLGRGILRIDQHKIPFWVLLGDFRYAAYEAAPVCNRPLCRDRYSLLTLHANNAAPSTTFWMLPKLYHKMRFGAMSCVSCVNIAPNVL